MEETIGAARVTRDEESSVYQAVGKSLENWQQENGKDSASPPTSVCSGNSETPSSLSTASSAEFSGSKEEKRRKCLRYFECAVEAFGATKAGMLLKKSSPRNDVIADDDLVELSEWIQSNIFNLPLAAVLELGGGVGRITPILQGLSKKLTVVDFIQEYIDANREANWRPDTRPDDQFLCADATRVAFLEQSYDLVFWNWLLMYLSEEEVKTFVVKALQWVKIGGYLFCRESCGEPSDKDSCRPWAVEGNPTEYRPQQFYTWLLTDYAQNEGLKIDVLFKEKPVMTYVEYAGTLGQRSWLLRRTG